MGRIDKIKSEVASDENLLRAAQYSKHAARELPRGTANYLIDKVPILQWLPRYSPRWIGNDIVAGLTVGVMLIPQGLAYAKIATIPVEYGLMSSWLPSAIYAFMGTSKELSTGPTSILGLLTASIVSEFKKDYAPETIASAIAIMVGVYCLIVGLFKLGFLLDYISEPVLTGFISAAAIVIMLGQIPSLLGENKVDGETADKIRGIFEQLPKADWRTALVGISGVVLLQLLQFVGKKWGKKNKIIFAISIGRAAIVLAIYTGISYGVNKDRPKDDPLIPISKVQGHGIVAPQMPPMDLIKKVAAKAFAPFIAAAIEHIAIGKAFGAKNGYVIDQSQELTYLGVTNFFNSFFSAMAVGGAMSRTAVADSASVRSPLNGLFTTGFVLLGIYKLQGALYWIPKATLAAIIVTAVYHLFGPFSVFYKFWRTSFADFVACMICFWVTLFVSAEQGIAFAVLFSIVYVLLRSAFASAHIIDDSALKMILASSDSPNGPLYCIPSDTKVFRFDEALLFPNADRSKDTIMDSIKVHHAPSASAGDLPERTWSVAGERRIRNLRRRHGILGDTAALPAVRVVVLDFSRVAHIDATGLKALGDLMREIKRYAGADAEVRFIGLTRRVRWRFERCEHWTLEDVDGRLQVEQGTFGVYPSLVEAVRGVRRTAEETLVIEGKA